MWVCVESLLALQPTVVQLFQFGQDVCPNVAKALQLYL